MLLKREEEEKQARSTFQTFVLNWTFTELRKLVYKLRIKCSLAPSYTSTHNHKFRFILIWQNLRRMFKTFKKINFMALKSLSQTHHIM